MRKGLYKLAKLYPQIMKIETADEKFGIPHYVDCGREVCKLDIVTLTDFQAPEEDKVQVYISGTLHGNEVIGPNVAYYLIEYMTSNYRLDPQISTLLKQREIIITPMTNAVGYYHNEREERINKDHEEFINNPNKVKNYRTTSFDINRDFPYNTEANQCLNTIAGRVVHQLFTTNLFVSALTFHGGTNVIGYPWGSFNRAYPEGASFYSKEAPDFQAFESLGWIMKNQTGGNIQKPQSELIQEYIFGDISSTIYPVFGGLEDWAYGAGWDHENNEATRFKCEPQTYLLKNVQQGFVEYQNVRTAIYIVETDIYKKPLEKFLGGRMIAKRKDGRISIQKDSIDEMNGQYDGHINRNIRLALSFIELSKPYIEIVNFTEVNEHEVEITWKVNGCHTLNEAKVIINDQVQNFLQENETGTCNYLMGRSDEQTKFTFKAKKEDNIILEAVADQHFAKSVNPQNVQPSLFINKPQLHLSKLRTQENYEAKTANKTLKGSKYIRLSKDQCNLSYVNNLDITQRNLALKELSQTQKLLNDQESLSCVLQPVFNQKTTGVLQITQGDNQQFSLNGQLNQIPIYQDIEVKIMEYGDLSSLAVEYPDYNSLGQSILSIYKATNYLTTTESTKISDVFNYPEGMNKLSDLTGRAVILTQNTDLIAFGILVNETATKEDSEVVNQGRSAKLMALCENLQSTVQYRAIFNINQEEDKVSFTGMIRTSTQMEDENEIIVSLNYKKSFDLDFDTAYSSEDKKENYFQWMHPCYAIKEESVNNQDWVLGRDLIMFGQHEQYNTKVLETSKCHIGLQNPYFRISDERFCSTMLDLSMYNPGTQKKYSLNAIINFFLIGFGNTIQSLIYLIVCGGIIGFLIYLSTKLTFKTEVDVSDENMKTAQKMEFIELTNQSVSIRHDDKLDDYDL